MAIKQKHQDSSEAGAVEPELVQIREKIWTFARDLGRHEKAIELLEKGNTA